MKRLCLLLVVGVLWTEADAGFKTSFPKKPPSTPQETSSLHDDEILETVFRHQMTRCSGRIPNKAYFLSYQKADLTDSFMQRFKTSGPRVRKQSERREFLKQHPDVFKTQILAITGIESRTDTLVMVMGYCGFNGLDFSSYAYRVEKKNGRWRVRSQRLLGFA